MTKIRLFFAVLLSAMSIATVSATVTITAPVKPEGIVEELSPGESYYLLNLDKCQFVNRNTSNSSYTGWSDIPYAFRLDESSEGYYALWQGSLYIGSYDRVQWAYSTSKTDTYVRLDIQKNADNSYRIREVYPDALWGYNSNSSYSAYVYSHFSTSSTGANVSWAFVRTNADTNEIQSYYYKKKLYDAIVATEANGYHVERYEDIYNDETKTNAEINAVANELNNSSTLSDTHSYLFPEWSDYPILITNMGSWERYYNEKYLYKYTSSGYSGSSNPNKGLTNSLKTSVYVDQPSTLSFIIDCNHRWINEPTMPIQVFVDGKLVYDYKGETYQYYYDSYFKSVLHGTYGSSYRPYGSYYNYNSGSHSYNRHFVNLEPGHHLVDIVTTQNYDGTNEFRTYFRQIGVEKVPTIEVNLKTIGSLGDEVLRAMDNNPLIEESHIRNARRLKISGKMGDPDFKEIYDMTELYSLDLTDAEITEIKTGQLSQYYHNSLSNLHELKLPKTLTRIGQEAFYATYIDSVDIPETVTSIGDFAFSNTRIREANIPNVTTIGHNAFRGCTMLNKVVMKKMESMGVNAFAECYNLKDIVLEGSLTTIPERAFYYCDDLELKSLPETITSMEQYSFYWNKKATFTLPTPLTTVDKSALESTYLLQGDIPAGVTSIGENAFSYAWAESNVETVNLPANSTFGNNSFLGAGMKKVVVPQEYYSLSATKMFANCDSLVEIKLMSPTKISVPADFVEGLTKKDIKVCVPTYLEYPYRRDSYWMDFTIKTFSTTELDSIVIHQDLALSQHDRFEGTPSLNVAGGVTFELEGSAGMELKNVLLNNDLNADLYAQIVSGTDHVNINGDMNEAIYTSANKWYFMALPFDCVLSRTMNVSNAKYAIRYYDGAGRAAEVYYTYPESVHNYANNLTKETEGNLQTFSYPGASTMRLVFNSSTKTYNSSDVIHIMDALGVDHTYSGTIGALDLTLQGDHFDIWITSNSSSTSWGYAIDAIYADGVLLPAGNKNLNWKDYDCTKDIIPAGTGFIFMTSQDSWTRFYSVDNGTKNRVFEDSKNENNEFHYALQKNPSENAANRGWNLVGNPYPNYYNNHKLSFAAPITLWDGTTYKAYSLRDDDIAIKPNQAVFVQCPEDVAEISWPAAGRQTTNVITDQANARPATIANSSRQLVDLSLSGNNGTDETRVVVNDEAYAGYEMQCDAAKFMSMDNSVPQLYSLDAAATRYSINERPYEEKGVRLGVFFPTAGEYTLAITRNRAEKVLLLDNETGMTFNIMDDDYTFNAQAGTCDNRFVLLFEKSVTSIENVNANDNVNVSERIYTPEGIEVKQTVKGKTYIMRGKNGVRKVILK